MPRDERRRQQALQRKAAKRKVKQQALGRVSGQQVSASGARRLPAAAGQWPVHECWISRDWQTPGELVQVLVARRSPAGAIGAGVFLVDLGCLGVKNAYGRLFDRSGAYEDLRAEMSSQQATVKTDLNLAAKVIREAIAYAGQFGFKPHADYHQARPVLEGADPDAAAVDVPLGIEGKPYFVSGPYDNVQAIMNKLTRAVGEGNFHYTVGISGDSLAFPHEDEVDLQAEGTGRGEPRELSGLRALFRNPFSR
jgi:hypothetical protein